VLREKTVTALPYNTIYCWGMTLGEVRESFSSLIQVQSWTIKKDDQFFVPIVEN
jgi:hypothetical protein